MVYIRRNVLLRGAEKRMSLDEARVVSLWGLLDDRMLRRWRERFGEQGLYRLMLMMWGPRTQPGAEYQAFLDFIQSQLEVPSSASPHYPALKPDNAILPQGREADEIGLSVLHPSLNRKLYNPGVGGGFVVWGLGGPDMLVSHPFRGVEGEIYGVVDATKKIAEHLMAIGYVGSYHFLDLLTSLSFEVLGQPAWLVWFGIVATHSDVVLFVREQGSDFSEMQKREIRITPNRVQKKIIEVPPGLLAPDTPDPAAGRIRHFVRTPAGDLGKISREEYERLEKGSAFATAMLDAHAKSPGPLNKLVRLDENGRASYYPLNHPIYGRPQSALESKLVNLLRRRSR